MRIDDHSPGHRWDSIYSPGILAKQLKFFLTPFSALFRPENAFHHFGGVPETIVIDNLKAAVTQADWYDPEINPKFQSFCRHYGTAIMPTKPRTPRHKGDLTPLNRSKARVSKL